MTGSVALPEYMVRERADTIAASFYAESRPGMVLRRLAARDVQAALERLEDEANDALLGSPGRPGNAARAHYLDRWRVATLHGLDGPFDARLGPLPTREA